MRDIWIFNEEDRGFGFEGSPRGYLKIEVRQGKGKVQALIQNLIELKAGQRYDLYLLKIKGEENQNIKIGSIVVNKGRGELSWEFDPFNVGDSNSIISDFNASVLVVKNEKKDTSKNLQCPLVAYKNKKEKIRWRDVLNSIVINNRNIVPDTSAKEDINIETNSIIDVKIDTTTDTEVDTATGTEIDAETNTLNGNAEAKRGKNYSQDKTPANGERPIVDENLPIDEIYSKYTGKAETRYSLYSEDLLSNVVLTSPSNATKDISEAIDRTKDEENDEDADDRSISNYDNTNIDEDKKPEDNNENLQDQVQENIYDEQYIRKVLYQDENTDVINHIEHQAEDQDNGKDARENKESEIDKNQNNVKKSDLYDKRKRTPDINRLVKLLDREFKRCDPFNSRRRDYRWWSINSPVNLVNVLEECRINVPSFFNPSVVMAYFKYRYLIAGLYISRRRGREYFVCGIPGTYSIDDSPFGDMCRWVQVERRNRAYGAFGYWVVYVDPNTGELLRFN